jgi:hypothetical protein
MLMQLPTPLGCISARAGAERGAGNEAGAFRFAGQHDVGDLGIGLTQCDQP